jgi:DNA-binding transcriptional MerR regulator
MRRSTAPIVAPPATDPEVPASERAPAVPAVGPARDDAARGDAAPDLLRIHDVAELVGLTPRSIRYYEEMGLLRPSARSQGAYRLYDESDIERLRFIKGLRDDAGFSLAEIGRLLEEEMARERNRARFRTTTDPVERRRIVTEALATVDRQIATLRSKIARLEAMVAEAEDRRAHLAGHLEDIDAGREPKHPPKPAMPVPTPRRADR